MHACSLWLSIYKHYHLDAGDDRSLFFFSLYVSVIILFSNRFRNVIGEKNLQVKNIHGGLLAIKKNFLSNC